MSPRIDVLASESTVLKSHYVNPMCTPTRASLLSGRHAANTGLQNFVLLAAQPIGLPLELKTLPQILHEEAGYTTSIVGKWHLGFAKRAYLPTHRGFDSFYGFGGGGQDYWNHTNAEALVGLRDGQNVLFNQSWEGVDFWRNDTLEDRQSIAGVHSVDLFSREVERVVSAVPTIDHVTGERQPMFLYIASQAPHGMWRGTPKRHVQKAEKAYAGANPLRREIAALISCLDELVGATVDALSAEMDADGSMWDRTLLVFSSDNGPAQGSGASAGAYRGWKGSVWEGGVHSVAFARVPTSLNDRPPVALDAPLHVADWFATLAKVAGVPDDVVADAAPDGQDMSQYLLGLEPGWQRSEDTMLLHVDQVFRCGSARDQRFKLVLNGDCLPSPTEDVWEMFDLQTDPNERTNLLPGTGGLSTVAEKLRRKVLESVAGAAPPLTSTTPADPKAKPQLHNGRWMNWLDEADTNY
eukprot:TRINITY_DN12924_c0_g1_i2.p1 TRINITY_DN12924_c0_g1~~TRINITY_DN12924_c0_g1_i2.p1  ORF type:complete len:468 (-),score=97.34 TRINITY_DN12924_c0_g1_i2:80-1483(-)